MIKDSGQREEFSNWFIRDIDSDKLRFDLIPIWQLKSLAKQYTDWMQKYWEDNWKLARWKKAIERFKQSAYRHFVERQEWIYDENHNDAAIFNIMAYEYHRDRMNINSIIFWADWKEVQLNTFMGKVQVEQTQTIFDYSFREEVKKQRYFTIESDEKERICSWLKHKIYTYIWENKFVIMFTYEEWKPQTFTVVPTCYVEDCLWKYLLWQTWLIEWVYAYDYERALDCYKRDNENNNSNA